MKLKIILTVATIIVLLCNSIFSYGQGCCGSSGSCDKNTKSSSYKVKDYSMYGGTVKQVGKYNIEIVFVPMLKRDPISFYLMTKRGKPFSNVGITGKAEFVYADGSTETVTLELKDENGFASQMMSKTQTFICFLTLKINGENVTARFDGGPAGKENMAAKNTYTCSMHPEVQSDKPGNCPKCGMALEK